MNEQKRTEDLLKMLRDVPSPDPRRQASARGAFLQEAARRRAERLAPRRPFGFPRLIPLRPLVVALLLVGLVLAGMTGTAYAADRARPGDPLYPLDRSLETLQLRLTSDPQRAATLRLAQAEERLLEAESLAASGDEAHLIIALEAYAETLETLPSSPQLDPMLSRHELRLRQLLAQTPERAHRGLQRALDAIEKRHSPPVPQENPPSPSSAPSRDHQGPPEESPGKRATKTPHRPPEGPPDKAATKTPQRSPDAEERGKEHPKGKD